MKIAYSIQSERLVLADSGEATSIFVYTQPDEQEKTELLNLFFLDPVDLESVNDPDEVPRVETGPDGTLIIWKVAENVTHGETAQFEVSSLGFMLKDGKAAVIVPRGQLEILGREFRRVDSPMDFVLRVMLHTIHHYQGHLKGIKAISGELEAKIVSSMENKYLLLMFTLGESLVYYHNALEANTAILAKLRSLAERLRMTADEMEFLDDVIIENQQAAKQAGIYSTVLSGLMDARGSIINNNMNVLLRNLTVINVVFLPLNLIAGIGGMSEYSMMTVGMDWRVSYGLFALAMATLGWLTWRVLTKVMEHRQSARSKG